MLKDQERWESRRAAYEQRVAAEREGMRGNRRSVWFSRSRLGAKVFYCRVRWLRPVLIGEGWPDDGASVMMGPTHLSVAFADRGWFSRTQSYSFGIGGLRGRWVVGFARLRYLCDLLGLVPQRPLKGEAAVPVPVRLPAELERQRVEDREALARRAELLLTPETQHSYLPEAVFGLLGAPRPRLVGRGGDRDDAGRRGVGVPRQGRCGMRIPIGCWKPGPGEEPGEVAERVYRDLRAALSPRCDYLPRGGGEEDRCPRPAALRVIRHGDPPSYRERCLLHAGRVLGPEVGAVWDVERDDWAEV